MADAPAKRPKLLVHSAAESALALSVYETMKPRDSFVLRFPEQRSHTQTTSDVDNGSLALDDAPSD